MKGCEQYELAGNMNWRRIPLWDKKRVQFHLVSPSPREDLPASLSLILTISLITYRFNSDPVSFEFEFK